MSLDITLLNPIRCKSCGAHQGDEHKLVWEGNITHNLGEMAKAVFLYDVLWQIPEGTKAGEISQRLSDGLERLRLQGEDELKIYEPANKWGTYQNLVEFVYGFYDACCKYPEARVIVSK